MILVVTGTEQFAFDRLVRHVDELRGKGKILDDVFMQLGSCQYVPRHCHSTRFLDFSDLSKRVDSADMVIAHAGAGTTLLCVERGKRLILVPRRKHLSEHVDDHQVPFARMMAELGVAHLVFDVADLESAIDSLRHCAARPGAPRRDDATLAEYVDSLLDDWGALAEQRGV